MIEQKVLEENSNRQRGLPESKFCFFFHSMTCLITHSTLLFLSNVTFFSSSNVPVTLIHFFLFALTATLFD